MNAREEEKGCSPSNSPYGSSPPAISTTTPKSNFNSKPQLPTMMGKTPPEKNTPTHPRKVVNFHSSSKSPPSKELDVKKARAQALMESPKSPRKRNEAIMISPRLRSEPMMGCESWEVVSKQDLSQRESIAAERFLRYLHNNQNMSLESARLAFSKVNTNVLLSDDEQSSIKFIRLEELEKLLKDLPPQDEKQYIMEWLNDLHDQEEIQRMTKTGLDQMFDSHQDPHKTGLTIESLHQQVTNFKNMFIQVSEKIFKKWILSNRLESIVSHLMLAYKEISNQLICNRSESIVPYSSIEVMVRKEVEKQLRSHQHNHSMEVTHYSSTFSNEYERLNQKIDTSIKEVTKKNDEALELMMDRILQDSEEQFSFLTSSIGNLQKDLLKLQHQSVASTLPLNLPVLSSVNQNNVESKEGKLFTEDLIRLKHAFESKLKEISGNMFGHLESTSNILERCNNIERTFEKKFRELKSKTEKETSVLNDKIKSMQTQISENDSKYLGILESQSWAEMTTKERLYETKLEETKKYFAHQISQLSQNIDHLFKHQDESEKSMQTIAKSNIQLTQDIHLLHTENYKIRELQEIYDEKISKIEIEHESLRNLLDKSLEEETSSKDIMKNMEHEIELHKDTISKLQSNIAMTSEKLSSAQQEINNLSNHQGSLECIVNNLRQDLISNTKDLQQHLKYQLDTNKCIETAIMNLESVRNENKISIQNVEIKSTERDSLISCIQKDVETLREKVFIFNESLLSLDERSKTINELAKNANDITSSLSEMKSYVTTELAQIKHRSEENQSIYNKSFQEQEDKISDIQREILEMKMYYENILSLQSSKLESLSSLKDDISSSSQRQQFIETELRRLIESLSAQLNQLHTHHKTIIEPCLQEYRLTFDTLGIWRSGIEDSVVLLKKKTQEIQNGHDLMDSTMHSLEKIVKDLEKNLTSQVNTMIKEAMNDLEKRMNELNTLITSNGLKLDKHVLTFKKDIDLLSKSSSTLLDALHHSERGLSDKISTTNQHIESIHKWKSVIDGFIQTLQQDVEKEKANSEQFLKDITKLQTWKQETDLNWNMFHQQLIGLQSSKEQFENSFQEKLKISEEKQLTIINVAHEEFIRIEGKLNEALMTISDIQMHTENLESNMNDRIVALEEKVDSCPNEIKRNLDEKITNTEIGLTERINALQTTLESKLEQNYIESRNTTENAASLALERVHTHIAQLQEWRTKIEENTNQRISSIHTTLESHKSTLEDFQAATTQHLNIFNTWKINSEEKLENLLCLVKDLKEHDDHVDRSVKELQSIMVTNEMASSGTTVQEKMLNMLEIQETSIRHTFNERFSTNDKSIQELRDVTDQIRNHLTLLNQNLASVEHSFKQQIVSMLENANSTCCTNMHALEQTMLDRLDTLSVNLDQRMDQHKRHVETALQKSTTLSQEIQMLSQVTTQLDHQIQQLAQHLTTLESQKLKEMDDNIVDIYKKIVKLYGQMDMQGEASKLMENIIGIQAVLSESHRKISDMCERSLSDMETHAVSLISDFCNILKEKREAMSSNMPTWPPTSGTPNRPETRNTDDKLGTVSHRREEKEISVGQHLSQSTSPPLDDADDNDAEAEYASMMQQILLLQSMAQNLPSSPQSK
nr:unnamed protein product [Naegleria fowleri]